MFVSVYCYNCNHCNNIGGGGGEVAHEKRLFLLTLLLHVHFVELWHCSVIFNSISVFQFGNLCLENWLNNMLNKTLHKFN